MTEMIHSEHGEGMVTGHLVPAPSLGRPEVPPQPEDVDAAENPGEKSGNNNQYQYSQLNYRQIINKVVAIEIEML